MGKLSGHVIAWAICIGITLVVGEIFGAILFYQQHGSLVYRNTLPPSVSSEPKSTIQYRQRIHPYLGFGGPYSAVTETAVTNNLGFPQNQPYKVPFKPAPNDFVVAVFGGSVAYRLAGLGLGGLPLQAALKERFPEKNVIVYCLAQGSGKQPQQVMALAMLHSLGQHVDVVLNVDAFNEFALGYSNISYGVHPIFPSLAVLWGIGRALEPASDKTDDFYGIAAELVQAKSAQALRINAANRSASGLTYLYNKAFISFYERQKAAAEAKYAAAVGASPKELAGLKTLMGIDMPPDPQADAWEELFQIWLRSSDAMAALSRAAGARYLHIIQPNQYFSNKQFSADEARIALALPENDPMRVGAEHGYPLLDQRSELLAARGIVSGIQLFDKVSRPMYADRCCHYNPEGETMFARFVAGQIAALPSK